MRRSDATLVTLLALALAGCAARQPPVPAPPPVPPSPEASAPPVTSELPPKPQGPAVVNDGSALRLVGIGDAKFVDWAPSGQTALVEASPALYRLRLDTRELHPMPDLGSVQNMGWAGPDAALLIRWSGDAPALGELSLLTGEWRPLARVSGRVQLCQSGSHWVWVDVKVVRQGGAGGREIGAVYRAPVPKPTAGSAPQPLDGKQVLEQGALLGRLADGSCLLDGLDQRLRLLRPDGDLQTIAEGFSLPEVTRDGRGVIWLEGAGDCSDCVELGPGVPFQRLTWWRLDGKKLTADLCRPQVISFLLSPDGERLIIGQVRYLTPEGASYRLSHPEPFLKGEQGVHMLGIYQPQAPYVSVRQDDGLLLVRLEAP